MKRSRGSSLSGSGSSGKTASSRFSAPSRAPVIWQNAAPASRAEGGSAASAISPSSVSTAPRAAQATRLQRRVSGSRARSDRSARDLDAGRISGNSSAACRARSAGQPRSVVRNAAGAAPRSPSSAAARVMAANPASSGLISVSSQQGLPDPVLRRGWRPVVATSGARCDSSGSSAAPGSTRRRRQAVRAATQAPESAPSSQRRMRGATTSAGRPMPQRRRSPPPSRSGRSRAEGGPDRPSAQPQRQRRRDMNLPHARRVIRCGQLRQREISATGPASASASRCADSRSSRS